MKTVEVQVFSFNELSESAKEVAVDRFRYINVDHDCWSESVVEFNKEKATQVGFGVEKVFFTGFWSQGDGAMFTYSSIDSTLLKSFVEQLNVSDRVKSILLSQAVVSGYGKHRGHYYHENSCDHYIYFESNCPYLDNITQLIEGYAEDFENYVIDIYKDLCTELYSNLSDDYDELTSDDCVAEAIISNGFEFVESGELF